MPFARTSLPSRWLDAESTYIPCMSPCTCRASASSYEINSEEEGVQEVQLRMSLNSIAMSHAISLPPFAKARLFGLATSLRRFPGVEFYSWISLQSMIRSICCMHLLHSHVCVHLRWPVDILVRCPDCRPWSSIPDFGKRCERRSEFSSQIWRRRHRAPFECTFKHSSASRPSFSRIRADTVGRQIMSNGPTLSVRADFSIQDRNVFRSYIFPLYLPANFLQPEL